MALGHAVTADPLAIPWTGRVRALPFRTVLAPCERYAQQYRRRHEKLTDWARQVLLQLARWLPGRRILAAADSRDAVIGRLSAVRHRLVSSPGGA